MSFCGRESMQVLKSDAS